MSALEYEDITYKIRAAAFEVSNILGPGFKESIYHKAFSKELKSQGLDYEGKKRIAVKQK